MTRGRCRDGIPQQGRFRPATLRSVDAAGGACSRPPAADDAQDWPQVAQPGAGLPAGLER